MGKIPSISRGVLNRHMANKRLGIGFIGSGFITRFHIKSLIGVRDADARGVWSPNKQRAEEAASLARESRVGDCRAFDSIEEMVASPDVDAIWLCGPNHRRVENLEAIVVSQTWDVVQDKTLSPVEKERRLAAVAHREMPPPPVPDSHKAEVMARRLKA